MSFESFRFTGDDVLIAKEGIRRLPSFDRLLLRLHLGCDVSAAELASAFSMTEENVERTVERALLRVREHCLQEASFTRELLAGGDSDDFSIPEKER